MNENSRKCAASAWSFWYKQKKKKSPTEFEIIKVPKFKVKIVKMRVWIVFCFACILLVFLPIIFRNENQKVSSMDAAAAAALHGRQPGQTCQQVLTCSYAQGEFRNSRSHRLLRLLLLAGTAGWEHCLVDRRTHTANQSVGIDIAGKGSKITST